MKTKGITIWEIHAEKMVLAVAVGVAGYLSVRQFIGQPNAVEVAGGRMVSPGEVDGLLQNEAGRYFGRLDDNAESELKPPLSEPKLAFDSLMAGLDASLSPAESITIVRTGVGPSVEWIGPADALRFAVPQLEAAHDVEVRQYADALLDGVLEEYPELKERLGDHTGPLDLKYATVFARFDVANLREQFTLSTDETELIPPSWYRDRPETIIDIVVRRQERVDGKWTNDMVIEQIPGRFSIRPRLVGPIDAGERENILDDLADSTTQDEVIQPEFYETQNDEWDLPLIEEPPEETVGSTNDGAKLRLELGRVLSQRARKVVALEAAGGKLGQTQKDTPPDDEDDRPPPRDRKRGGGGSGRSAPGQGDSFGTGGGGQKRTPGGDSWQNRKNRNKIEKLKKQIASLDRQIQGLERNLEAFGGAGDVVEVADGGFDLTQDDEVWVWAHDIDLKPGSTYRYAMTVKVYNPLFGRKRSLVEDQAALADRFTLDTPESDWSSPARIKPFISVFITAASPAGQSIGGSGLGRATAEVHRFADGSWWTETFSVQPGDVIGGVKQVPDGNAGDVEIDFSTGLVIVDIIDDLSPGNTAIGKSARVLMQDLATGEMLEIRHPHLDTMDPERRRLKDREAERIASSRDT